MTEHNIQNQDFLDVWQSLCEDTKKFYETQLFGYELLSDNQVRELVGSLKAIRRLEKEPQRKKNQLKLEEDKLIYGNR